MELWDKDPGGLAGDLGRRLREAGKERGKELLTCGSGPSGNAGSRGRAAERRRARGELGRGVGSEWAAGCWLRGAEGERLGGKESLCCLRLGRPGGESGLGPVAEFWAGLV